MKNLCDLLSQQPDVSDAPGAKAIPILRVWSHNRKARSEGKYALALALIASILAPTLTLALTLALTLVLTLVLALTLTLIL